jgi:hypothetical protein
MAEQNYFGVPTPIFKKILQIAIPEAGDPDRGARPGTLASMINRYHNPDYGSNASWLNPDQYAAMNLRGFNKIDPSKALAYYGSDKGRKDLTDAARQLKGVTDFRATEYLQKIGKLTSYPDNLIPAMVGGVQKYLTPEQLRLTKATPFLGENTFFNAKKRPATKKWWEEATPQQRASESPVNSTDTIAQQIGAGNLFGGMTLENIMRQGIQEEFLTSLIQPEEDKTNLFAELLNQTRPYYS